MKKETYSLLEHYMLSCVGDGIHAADHVYRVLFAALDIASAEPGADLDVLTAACLLHDVGRPEEAADPALCHAQVGAEKAFRFLLDSGFSRDFAQKVRRCVAAHRFRSDTPPESLEAKILFDADKLDVTGAIGIARTLAYGGRYDEPLCTFLPDGSVCDGSGGAPASFLREYRFKLQGLYDHFYTARGAQLARGRRAAARDFYERILEELRAAWDGRRYLEDLLQTNEKGDPTNDH